MSRSALSRQEGARKQREREAEELFELAVEEGRNNRSKGLLPLWGPDDSFHFNPMLLQNTIKSPYFQKCCRDLLDWNTLVDEIYYKVDHLEPWTVGSSREPSIAFCLLLRLLTLRCTEKQMQLLLDHPDSPYIRGIGFLYLRYVCDPKVVWSWIEPYINDDEPLTVAANAQKNQSQRDRHPQTIGDYVKKLFSSERNYYGTMLPRLPTQIERDIQVNLLLAEKIDKRAKKHLGNPKTMEHFKKLGSKVMALYGDEENPTTWYEAVVDRVLERDEQTGEALRTPKFVVTFHEYGNTETVTLGEMELCGVPLDPIFGGTTDYNYEEKQEEKIVDTSDWRRGENDLRRGNHSRRHDPGNLYEEVRRRERDNVTSTGNRGNRRPPSAKESLMASSGSSDRRKDHDRDWPERSDRSSSSNRNHQPQQTSSSRRRQEDNDLPGEPDAGSGANASEPPRKRSPEEIAVIQEKKRRLMAKYG